ncbi:MAG: hypothetical protein P1U88_17335 [Thalassobaculaceae bacterium]|nr:hypothetical protein [Thalassobaculaceae bacterium]
MDTARAVLRNAATRTADQLGGRRGDVFAMTFSMIEVRTRWIGEDGRNASPMELFGKVNGPNAHFVLHTLGWIRINFFGQTYEVALDPRSVRGAAVERFVAWMDEMHADKERPWLVKISAFTGRDWISVTDTAPEGIIAFLDRILEFGKPSAVPETLQVTDCPLERARSFGVEAVNTAIARWQESQQGLPIDDPSVRALLAISKPGCTVKILSRDGVGRIVFGTYTPSLTTLWSQDSWGRFPGAPVGEVVPDRALGSAVETSARRVMETGQAKVETWEGPVLSSSGVIAELAWDRLTLPLTSRVPNDAVLVVTHRLTPIGQGRLAS